MGLVRSFIAGMRAARRIGTAEKRGMRGDLEGAMRTYAEALQILDQPGVDLETPWCGSAATVALWGYCWAAAQLQRHAEAADLLTQWRSRYLPWLAAPVTADQAQCLKWFEELARRECAAKRCHATPSVFRFLALLFRANRNESSIRLPKREIGCDRIESILESRLSYQLLLLCSYLLKNRSH